jgi:hypothetical protein
LNPAVGNLMQRNGIQVVQLEPSSSHAADEIGRLEHREVLAHRLARHFEVLAQLPERLPVVLAQPVEQQPTAGVGQRLEHQVQRVIRHSTIMQVITCLLSNAQVTQPGLAGFGVTVLR